MRKFMLLIIVLLLIIIEIRGQERWVHQYLETLDVPGNYMSISYDEGYLLSGRILPNYQFTWLIKTNINGEILWQKRIWGYYDRIIIDCFKQNDLGEIFLSGGVINDGNTDPLILKLDACGEKEWCRSLSTTSNNDFFTDIVTISDAGCAGLIFGAYYPLNDYRSGILWFSSSGDLIRQQYYQSQDQGVNNEILSNLLLTPDSGFLMTGYCGYPDSNSLYWLHPYYVKVDSQGNFEWEIVLHGETGNIGGKAWQTILSPSEKYYYSCISHYYHSDTLYAKRPALVKIDLQGNVIGVFDLVNEDYDFGTLFSAAFINDSLLSGGASWFYSDEEPQSRAIVFDTLGHIRDSIVLLNTGWLSKTAVTHDGKLLYYNTIEEETGFDTYLFKLTQNLEQDTFYTSPYVYDSLCPYQIVSDTIVPDDCGVIVGVADKETRRQGDKERVVEVWPNPCSTVLSVSLKIQQSAVGSWHSVGQLDSWQLDKYMIEIYDIFGRKVPTLAFAAPIPAPSPTPGKGDWSVNVSALPPGLYLVVVKDGQTVVGSAKFVVSR